MVSGLYPLCHLNRPRLNTPPWLNRLSRAPKTIGADVVSQIMADMFMQVFIELHRRYHKSMVTVKCWRVVRSCRFLQSEDSGVTAADKADFGGEEFLERKAFG